MLCEYASILSSPLSILFNKSLAINVFPSILKQSEVVPFLKREIEILRTIEQYHHQKILKSFLNCIVYMIFSLVKLQLSDYQYGYLRGRSKTSYLLSIKQHISDDIDRNCQVEVIKFLWSYLRSRTLFFDIFINDIAASITVNCLQYTTDLKL